MRQGKSRKLSKVVSRVDVKLRKEDFNQDLSPIKSTPKEKTSTVESKTRARPADAATPKPTHSTPHVGVKTDGTHSSIP